MNQINQKRLLSGKERQEIIARLFAESKKEEEKTDDIKLKLLVPIEGIKSFELYNLAYSVLTTLEQNPSFGLDWASHYGRTGIVVSKTPNNTILPTELKSVADKGSVDLATNKSFRSRDFINPDYLEGAISLYLTDETISIEGIARQVVGLVDEAIYQIYKKFESSDKTDQANQTSLENYLKAVKLAKRAGFKFIPCSESKILEKYNAKDSYYIRLYGNQGPNRISPRIMGAVDIGQSIFEDLSLYKILEVQPQKKLLNNPIPEYITKSEITKFDYAPCIFGITLTKDLHIGHIFSIALADIAARSFNGLLVIVANDVAPRVTATVLQLCLNLKISPKICLERLKSKEIDSKDVSFAYTQRKSNQEIESDFTLFRLFNQCQKSLDNYVSEFSETPFQSSLDYLKDVLAQFSIEANILTNTEANITNDQNLTLESEIPGFESSGFKALRFRENTKNQLVVLGLSGKNTYQSSVLNILTNVSKLKPTESVVVFDAEPGTKVAINTFNALSDSQKAYLSSGFGVIFDDKIASSTDNNSLSLDTFFSEFKLETQECFTLIKYFILTRICTSDSNFDYKSQEYLLQDLKKAYQELKALRLSLSKVKNLPVSDLKKDTNSILRFQNLQKNPRLDNLIKTVNIKDQGFQDFFKASSKYLDRDQGLVEIYPLIINSLTQGQALCQILKEINDKKPELISKNCILFKKIDTPQLQKSYLIEILSKVKNKSPEKVELEAKKALESGCKSRIEILEYLYNLDLLDDVQLFTRYKSTLPEIFKSMGFFGQDLNQKIISVWSNEKTYTIRQNSYFAILNNIIKDSLDRQSISLAELEAIKVITQIFNI